MNFLPTRLTTIENQITEINTDIINANTRYQCLQKSFDVSKSRTFHDKAEDTTNELKTNEQKILMTETQIDLIEKQIKHEKPHEDISISLKKLSQYVEKNAEYQKKIQMYENQNKEICMNLTSIQSSVLDLKVTRYMHTNTY